jgi:CubicO group peptidase (beta-lactamase class C family)
MARRGWGLACAVLLLTGPVACSGGSDDERRPAEPGAAWDVDTPVQHGMDPETLQGARDYAFADGMNTQGVVVVQDGAIVAEWYADGAGEDSWAASWSIGKSFASALVGIAIGEGLIPSVDAPMTTWFPEWAGTDRAGITLRDVLQMSSGLDWVEDYHPQDGGRSDVVRMVQGREDQLAYAAGRPAAAAPGSVWYYSSGDSMLLSGVLEKATGMRADEYARRKLFDPIGMDEVEWWRDGRGHTLTYCCVDTTSRGFARFGLLYEQDGSWKGRQVVPRSWVDESLEPAPESSGAYGYQWWLAPPDGQPETGLPADTYSARGLDDQCIYVIPSLDLVVVRNGTYVKDPGPPVAGDDMLDRYPSGGIVEGKGTVGPGRHWHDAEFLGPIVRSFASRS